MIPSANRDEVAIFYRLVSAVLWMGATLAIGGCGQQEPHAPTKSASLVSLPDRPPQEYLQAIFDRYRNVAGYQDQAQVEMSYQTAGTTETQIAPLSVWFDRRELYVQAYDVRIWADSQATTAWIRDPASADFDSQVARTSGVKLRPELDVLLADSILFDRLSAGLAGPPPQLDWMFASNPMQHLFDSPHQMSYVDPTTIEGRSCVGVEVIADQQRFVFWVDQRGGVIRRVELPTIRLDSSGEPKKVSDEASNVKLTLNLRAASFHVSQRPVVDPLPSQARFVRKFVPLPPPPPSALLGTFGAATGGRPVPAASVLEPRILDRPITILVRQGTDGFTRQAVEALAKWEEQLPASMRRKTRVGLIANATRPASSAAHEPSLPSLPDLDGRISETYQLAPGSIVVLSSSGRVEWVEPSVVALDWAKFGAIVNDLLDGVDVPDRALRQWQQSVGDYQKALRSVAILAK